MVQFLFVFNDWGLLIFRLALGSVLVAHGLPKILHFSEKAKAFREMGFRPPKMWVLVACVTEFLGGLLLIAGFLTQIVSFFVAAQFLVILLKVRWLKRQNFSAWEYDLLIFASALLLVATGGGRYGLDGYFNLVLY